MAIVNIHDFIVIKKNKMGKIKAQLPTSVKKVNHKIIKKFIDKFMDSPICVIITIFTGMIIASTEFLCSGQLYLSTIVAVIQNNADGFIIALGYLTLYSVICTVPLIVVLVLLSKGIKEFEVSLFIINHLAIIKIMYAIVFILMAIICWFQVF